MNNKIMTEKGYDAEKYAFYGNKFLTGNGYMGVRGTLSEYRSKYLPAVNLAGVYDKVGDGWRESVNAPNGLYTYIEIDKDAYTLPEKTAKSHEMTLDIYNGVLYRKTVFSTEKGDVELNVMRAVSMHNKNLILEKITVKPDFDCSLCIYAGIDNNIWDINGPHLKDCKTGAADGVWSEGITSEKGITVRTHTKAEYEFDAECEAFEKDNTITEKITVSAEAGKEYTVNKYITVSSSEDKQIKSAGEFENELEAHKKAWNNIADESYMEIEGDDEAELNLNYSLYHLNCIAPRHAESLSIPARGLSGQVYKGAVFWDTEMFMLDYFLYNFPDVAKTLLRYRTDTLGGAVEKAGQYGLDGAFYAWESQEGGFDACSDYNVVDVFTKRPMRTYFKDRQVHISAAIVYAFEKYITATGDMSVLTDGGADVILKCAEFYRSLLIKRAVSDEYEIRDVVGPDEYHERVYNNAYTNKMAAFVFETVLKYADYIDADVSRFEGLAENMYAVRCNKDGVIEQFDGYFGLEDCSLEEVRSRLLDPKEYWGGAYGVASDTQIIKQADVVAMMSMFEKDYTKEQMKANLDYYEPRTEHGSSLSACMYSLLYCYTKEPDKAYPFFMKSASADVNPGGKEWAGLVYIGGTHPASEGGAWIVAVKGFAGLKIKDGKPIFEPSLPKKWKKMKFKLTVCGKRYNVEITGGKADVTEA